MIYSKKGKEKWRKRENNPKKRKWFLQNSLVRKKWMKNNNELT